MITQNHNCSEIDNNAIKTSGYTPKACGRCGEPPADCWCTEGFLDDY
jgi:hypothetical protein